MVMLTWVPGFLSRSWRITSAGMFAGSCIGIICLVCSLELLRRLGKEYDRYLVRQSERQSYRRSLLEASDEAHQTGPQSGSPKHMIMTAARRSGRNRGFKPSAFQQFIRALLHMLQFGVAYFIMLLAMYYNGYFLICILIGALIGSFFFNWESLGVVSG